MSGQITKVFVADARRRWSDEDKQIIIEESKTAPVARVAKKYGVATSLLFRWRRQQGIGASPLPMAKSFAPVVLSPPEMSGSRSIEIVLGNGRRILVSHDVEVATLKRVIEALEIR
ncbi:MAG: transposase [Proteobacteria bacterium]|nr:transposase [Pseudomonadota bacterium]